MAWPIPKFSRSQVNKAGGILVREMNSPDFDFDQWFWAFEVLSNWRACHGYPINTFQATLRQKLKKIDEEALVAQRLKRTPSILTKLQRFSNMNLSRMQDIGGLRAVVGSMYQLKKLHLNYKTSRFTHDLVSEYNYIASPKPSGYRSIHLVYKYSLKQDSPYNGLQLELQLRTKLQHAWATAVETVGTFLEHPLKSSEGPDDWLKFFSLAGSAFSYLEDSALVPGYETLGKKETFIATTEDSKRLGIRDMLLGYSSAVKAIPPGTTRAAYYLVQLNLQGEEKSVSIRSFARDQLERANTEYMMAEKRATDGEQIQVVLVSAGSVDSLRRAYPNYFLDTHDFLHHLKRIEKAS
jgi:hypothetical protein